MTTTNNLSGDEVPTRFLGKKPSDRKKKKALKDAILQFEKDSKSKKKKKVTAGDIIRRKNLEEQ